MDNEHVSCIMNHDTCSWLIDDLFWIIDDVYDSDMINGRCWDDVEIISRSFWDQVGKSVSIMKCVKSA